MKKYFAYGSNLLPKRIEQRVGPLTSIGAAILPNQKINFSKISTDGSGKCTIVPCRRQNVHGVVYELSLRAKALLDEIEGIGKGYQSVLYKIDGFGECFAYVAEPAYIDENIKPYEWYKQLVLQGCQFHRFPKTYIKRIQSYESIPDLNQLRSDNNLRLIKRLG
jgi:gamma-glutamylcyclotransferase (GGCT)/AIG2-like uncharacterized protein YtfP